MTFEEFGAALRAEREKRGLDIDDIADQLKINPRQLRALESGDIDSLPHPAYARGFIRSYANFLGMSKEEIHQALDNIQSQPLKQPSQASDIQVQDPHPEPQAKKGKGLLILAILCILGGGGYYAWHEGYVQEFMDQHINTGQDRDELQSADSAMAEKDAARTREPEKSEPPREEPSHALPIGQTVPAPMAVEGVPDNTPAEAATEAISSAAAEEPQATSQDSGKHKLIITAIEECWINSTADKTDTRQFSLRKGDTFALPFSESLQLKLGNAGGVRLRYDGRDLPPAGTSGQVKTITFPPKEN